MGFYYELSPSFILIYLMSVVYTVLTIATACYGAVPFLASLLTTLFHEPQLGQTQAHFHGK